MTTMTPSAGSVKTTTAGQIDKAVGNYRALLEKHAGEFNSEAVQMVLGQSELASEQLAVFRCRVEAISNLVIRHVRVDRTHKPQEVLDATGRKQYTDRKVVDEMPRGEGDEKKILFVKPDLSYYKNGWISDEVLDKWVDEQGFKFADPYSVIKANVDDPALADTHPNAVHWKNGDSKWCYIAFGRWGDERSVYVGRYGDYWYDYWSFGVVRK